MNKTLLLYSVFFLVACNFKKSLIKYQDSINKYYVQVQISKNKTSEDSLLTFYDFNNPSQVREIGFYKDGFRNDLWTYNFSTGIKTITWGHYKDKSLKFETNLFEKVDSIKYGEYFTKYLFKTDMGNVVLNVVVNSPFKDSLPEKNYRHLIENEFSKMGVQILEFKTNEIFNKPNAIYINELKLRINSNNEIKYLKSAFSFIDNNNFVDFSVSTSENNIYRNILFDAVLTNFIINGKRLYNPFHYNLR